MDDAMCAAGSSSATTDTNAAPRPVLQNRVPIWKRHVFPASPAVSVDPFELPPNLTPALKRVKSRTKLPAKGSATTSSLSRLPSSSECNLSSAVPLFPVRSSPRKKPPSPVSSRSAQPGTQSEATVGSEAVKPDAETAVSNVPDERCGSRNPSRIRSPYFPISLPPKKPRLAFMAMSTSDLRPPRKPIMVEPDFQQVPSSSTALSRLPKALRNSSVDLKAAPEKDAHEQKTSQNDLAQPSSAALGSSKMFHSRSTMCLRLTPERDMRERRRSGTETATVIAPRASPKRKLQSSATVSDLRQSLQTPTRRGRRISLSDADSKKPSPKPLRKRSSSLQLRGIKADMTALCSKEVNEDKPREEKVLSHSLMLNSTETSDDVPVEAEADSVRKDVEDRNELVCLEPTPSQNNEEFPTIPNAEKEANTAETFEEAATSQSSPTQDASNILPRDCPSADSVVPERDLSLEPSNTGTCCVEDCLEGLKKEDRSSMEIIPSEIRPMLTSNDDTALVDVAAVPETVPKNDAVLEPADYHASIESGANSEATSERTVIDTDVSVTCYCSMEASSSTSTCAAESTITDAQAASISKAKVSMSAPAVAFNSSLKTSKAESSLDKRVRFQNVNVFYFARTQGMSTVPKTGEVSLGMVDKHFTKRQFPLWLGRRPELTLPRDYEEDLSEGEDPGDVFDPEGHERCTAHQLPMFEGKARIKMLKRSGVQVQKDGSAESLEAIRKSRIMCGCQCERGLCKPATCQCSLDGIGCQVDGPDEFGKSHPCSCTRATCLNPNGRIEFDPDHVKNHFRITMMRLKHAEQKGLYDSPQRIRFTSEGEPQSVAHFTPPPQRSTSLNGAVTPYQYDASANEMEEPPTRKFPVTPVYKKSKQKRGLRVELAADPDSAALFKVKTKLSWDEPLESGQDQKITSSATNQY